MTDAQRLAALEDRVRKTICPTFGSVGGTMTERIEGRIAQEDFDWLLDLLGHIKGREHERAARGAEQPPDADLRERESALKTNQLGMEEELADLRERESALKTNQLGMEEELADLRRQLAEAIAERDTALANYSRVVMGDFETQDSFYVADELVQQRDRYRERAEAAERALAEARADLLISQGNTDACLEDYVAGRQRRRSEMFILVNIGCIECGVSSNIVGVYESEAAAYRDATILSDKLELREGGQNSYEVFPLPEPNVITDEYRGPLRASDTEDEAQEEELVSRGR